eukprot:TRINITY_DN74684_c0_g1_i1.p1 TRINITY_DN74684_c0_g1~~TRINITY_DN74684_c0_g1_i1.p1  ORF type:complete len:335 (-),score=63.83 TRINITY_DN74684_c0_g1_i1:152-1156(-)
MATAAPDIGAGKVDDHQLPSLEDILAATSLFEALGLEKRVYEPSTVKQRYKQLALKVHPDKCSDPRAKEAFQRVSKAFDALHTRESQERHLRERGRRKDSTAPHRQKHGSDGAREGTAWWDTGTWAEFERRFKKRERMEAALRAKFFTHVQGKFQHRKLRQQVFSAERSCEQLDRLKKIGESDLWAPEFREEYPGKSEMQVAAFEGAKTTWDEVLERKELDCPEYCASRLLDLLTHLRTVHIYCLHCGCHFDDEDDLEKNCPGFDEEAHDNADNMAMRRSEFKELNPPPKKKRGPERPPPREDDDVDDAFGALLAAARGRADAKPITPAAAQGR